MEDSTIGLLGKLFIERRDVFAQQHPDGSYAPVRQPIKLGHLRAHVTGRASYGHYMVSPEGKCRLFAFDIDAVKSDGKPDDKGIVRNPLIEWDGMPPFNARTAILQPEHPAHDTMIAMLNGIAEGMCNRIKTRLKIPALAAYSGRKGIHVYGFCGPAEAELVQSAANKILESFGFERSRGDNFWQKPGGSGVFEIERFPKQTSVNADGFGNLMRLPLGKHAVTGRHAHFLRFAMPRTTLHSLNPAQCLPWAASELADA